MPWRLAVAQHNRGSLFSHGGTSVSVGVYEWRRQVGEVLVSKRRCNALCTIVLPPFQIISHSKNLGESKFFKFDQIYTTR